MFLVKGLVVFQLLGLVKVSSDTLGGTCHANATHKHSYHHVNQQNEPLLWDIFTSLLSGVN